MKKRNLFMHALAQGRLHCGWESRSNLRSLQARIVVLVRGADSEGHLSVGNKDLLETRARDNGRHWPLSPHA